MKAEDLKTKTADELNKLLLDARKDQMNQRFQKTNGALEKTDAVRKTRRTIAQIKTFLSAKARGEDVKVKKAAAPKASKADKPKAEAKAKKPAATKAPAKKTKAA